MTLFDEPDPAGDDHPSDPPSRRHSTTGWWVALGALVIAIALGASVMFAQHLPEPVRGWLLPAQGWVAQTLDLPGDWGPVPEPSAAVATLADQMSLTDSGREVFYRTEPELVGDDILTLCERGHGGEPDPSPSPSQGGETEGGAVTLGCYRPSTDRMYLFEPGDERLTGFTVTFAAHELLHAVYGRMSPDQQREVDALVAAEAARIPEGDPVLAQIEASVGADESRRGNELFAYLGSQVEFDGGFTPELEALYSETFADRSALVAVHAASIAVLDGVRADVEAAWSRVAEAETTAGQARAQWNADQSWYDQALARHSSDLTQFEETPEAERGSYVVTFTTFDGERRQTSWEEYLRFRADELDGLAADLAAREPAIVEQEAQAAELRAQTEALTADANALFAAAFPGSS